MEDDEEDDDDEGDDEEEEAPGGPTMADLMSGKYVRINLNTLRFRSFFSWLTCTHSTSTFRMLMRMKTTRIMTRKKRTRRAMLSP